MPDPIHVLLSAFTCLPGAGSEPGNGWNWAIHLAERGMKVRVLTNFERREYLEAYLRDHPTPNIEFSYVAAPVWRFKPLGHAHYAIWQWTVVKAAKALHRELRFDVVHHVTYGSIHVPSQLWRLGVPTVFGPVGGGQTAPPKMLSVFVGGKRFERARTLVTKLLPYSPPHRRAMRKMGAILVINSATEKLVRKMGRPDVEFRLGVGLPQSFLAPAPRTFGETRGPLRLLWVGRMLPRKALPLALDAFAQVQCDATLTIAGNGLEEPVVRQMIAERGLTDRVFWQGKRLPWLEVRQAYLEHDAFLFTSLRESSGGQLLEAMALGLPIILLDLPGPQDLVPDAAGIKVPVTTPAETARELAAAIDRFAGLPSEERTAMSSAAWEFAKTMTWDKKAAMAEGLYRRLIESAG